MKNVKKRIEKFFSICFLLLLFSSQVVAQQKRTVEGTVVDEKGEPLIGASVLVKGKPGMGAITDFDGHFVLEVPENNKSVFD